MLNTLRITLAISVVMLISGCATYQSEVDTARRSLRDNPEQTVELLKPKAETEGRDQLVYLLDYATALQAAGRFDESARAFLQAERLADLKDYHSVSQVAASLALSEEMVQYKGDDFEKVLINGLNAINYLELGQFENAVVQVRAVNNKLNTLRTDERPAFNQSPFAFYLGAVLFEADRDFDNAYILYTKAYEVAPQYPPLRADLIRAALQAQRADQVERWKKQFPDVEIRPEWKDRKLRDQLGELVLIFQQGWGPRKAQRPEAPRYPKLVPVGSIIRKARVHLTNEKGDTQSIDSSLIYSIEDIAVKALEDDYSRLVASRVGGVATKAVLADQVRQKNEALGQLAWIAMNMADRADLRQWSTLPASFQLARKSLPTGRYKVRVEGLDLYGNHIADLIAEREIKVEARKKVFVNARSFD
jgi:hypothetical protein